MHPYWNGQSGASMRGHARGNVAVPAQANLAERRLQPGLVRRHSPTKRHVLTGFAAGGTPVTETTGYACPGQGEVRLPPTFATVPTAGAIRRRADSFRGFPFRCSLDHRSRSSGFASQVRRPLPRLAASGQWLPQPVAGSGGRRPSTGRCPSGPFACVR
jgi:hypothetical protein